MDREPSVPASKLVGASASAVGRTRVSTKRSDSVNNRVQAGKNLLEILIFDLRRINAQMLSNNTPDRLEVLLLGRCKLILRDDNLANRFENIARGRHSLTRRGFSVTDRSEELLIDSLKVKLADELFKRAAWCSMRPGDSPAPHVLELALSKRAC